MSVFQIEEARREGARLVVGLGGVSGGGKTATAIRLAWGLANYNAKKVGFICTENKRGRLYANDLVDEHGVVHRFLIGDLTAPFSPQRYIDAIAAFEKAGVEVLVIDSVSHEWEGMGGCEDIANAGNPRNPAWNKAKSEHKRFMNALLQSPMHIIVCLRAREKVKLVKRDGKTEYEPQGVLPIQEKNFTFELTASMMMWNGGKSRDVLKCPAELVSIFGQTGELAEGYLTPAHGKQLRDWVDGADQQLDPEVERARSNLSLVCENGVDALAAAWAALPAKVRKAIGADGLEILKNSAAAFDAQRAAGGADMDALNDEILSQPAAA
jgi:hypothetical protein